MKFGKIISCPGNDNVMFVICTSNRTKTDFGMVNSVKKKRELKILTNVKQNKLLKLPQKEKRITPPSSSILNSADYYSHII